MADPFFGASALLGAGLSAASSGIDFGLGAAAAKMQYKFTRKLRRREFQDQMYSMRRAGLNPMLAANMAPGHSAASLPDLGDSDLQRDVASAQESGRRSNLNAAEKELLEANRVKALSDASKAKSEAATAEYLREAQYLELQSRSRNLGAEASFTEGPRTAAEWGLAELRGKESAYTSAKTRTENLRPGNIAADTALKGAQLVSESQRPALLQSEKFRNLEQGFLSRADAYKRKLEMPGVSAASRSAEAKAILDELQSDFYRPGGPGEAMRKANMSTAEITASFDRVVASIKSLVPGYGLLAPAPPAPTPPNRIGF